MLNRFICSKKRPLPIAVENEVWTDLTRIISRASTRLITFNWISLIPVWILPPQSSVLKQVLLDPKLSPNRQNKQVPLTMRYILCKQRQRLKLRGSNIKTIGLIRAMQHQLHRRHQLHRNKFRLMVKTKRFRIWWWHGTIAATTLVITKPWEDDSEH